MDGGTSLRDLRPYRLADDEFARFPKRSAAALERPSAHAHAPSTPPTPSVLASFAYGAGLTFLSTAIVMPFEVSKTLAQVQWIPREAAAFELADELSVPEDDDDEDEDVESYFEARPKRLHEQPQQPRRPTSPSGYLARPSLQDPATRPEWTLPILVQGGVWDMLKSIARWRGEGWSSLWKGQLTTCIYDALAGTIQPLLTQALTLALIPRSHQIYGLAGMPLVYASRPAPLLAVAVAANALTSVILAPIDLVRTRLIVQSAQPRHRKYSGPLDALATIAREEGGALSAWCMHPHILYPALIDGIVRPLAQFGAPLLVARGLGIEPSVSPVLFALAQFALSCGSLLVTTPLETVRRRLQAQHRAPLRSTFRTCVETRPVPYHGMLDCIYRILTEETGRIARPVPSRRASATHPNADDAADADVNALASSNSGLRQLYRGLNMGLALNSVTFLLGLLGNFQGSAEWTEM